ncbi:hypothetical protein MATL_G00220370 [Megalops atlanticus]|uniref:C-X-C motif chemokine n=1 Tax=Megalops atlanticus TaxID=7932 RepID=A0A9D3PG29_MEGAT|nr:hypothetical protein MATL_G00220370 [Megalops atlanticus]
MQTCAAVRVVAICLMCLAGFSEGFRSHALRCKCIKKETRFIGRNNVKEIQVIPSSTHCTEVEVIATLKGGLQICLDPSAPWVRAAIRRSLRRAQRELKERDRRDAPSARNQQRQRCGNADASTRNQQRQRCGNADASRSSIP